MKQRKRTFRRLASLVWLAVRVQGLMLLHRVGFRSSVDRWAGRLLDMQAKGMWDNGEECKPGRKKARVGIPRL